MTYGIYSQMLPVCEDCPSRQLQNLKSIYEDQEVAEVDAITETAYITACKLLGAVICDNSAGSSECVNKNAEFTTRTLMDGIRANRA